MAAHEQNRAKVVDENFVRLVSETSPGSGRDAVPGALDAPIDAAGSLTGRGLLEILESQMAARHLDLVARELRRDHRSFYTIGSAGHEANALVGRFTRIDDPAFLHYRSGGFMMERSRKDPSVDPLYDTLLSIVASADDPISGGRHKVWGSRRLWVLPQTSTIASHFPKAMGTAISIRRAEKLGLETEVPGDAIVVCSFGDASVNHSTAVGALNATVWAQRQKLPVPLLFVCEDNGLGISVRTPTDWIEGTFRNRRGIVYLRANGLDTAEAARTVEHAVNVCRTDRRPVFLHLRVVRLLGHAGTDVETEYLEPDEIEATEALDPVLATARAAIDRGLATPDEVLERYETMRERVRDAAARATARPRLETREAVLESLAPLHPDRVHAEAIRPADPEKRRAVFASRGGLPEDRGDRHLAAAINLALFDLMIKYPEAIAFGEDVAKKGGVYHVTTGLFEAFKGARVFNTLLDEQSILGLAQGAGYLGMLPIPEIQYLAYFHNASDQIRGEACSTQFFSRDQFRNPMVLRIASLGYQKGFGGHFHNDNSIAALRDIPGLILACPSRADDAVAMLRTAAALARVDGRVVAFLEPIALYMRKDLHEPKDRAWTFPYPSLDQAIPLGEVRVYHPEATDLVVLTYGNGVVLSLQAAERVRTRHGIGVRVVDLRWLNPLPTDAIAEHAASRDGVIVVDEGRRTGGVGEGILAAVAEKVRPMPPVRRIAGADTYIPLGPAAECVLPSSEEIEEAAIEMTRAHRAGADADATPAPRDA